MIALLILTLSSLAGAQLIFKSSLDNENMACWENRTAAGCGAFPFIQPVKTTSLVEDAGGKALRIAYLKNEQQGGVEIKISESHVFTKFHFRYGPGFDFGCGVKSHRIRSMNEAKGENNYDIILYTKAAELCGVNDMRSLNIARNGGAWWGAAYIRFEREKWYELETEIKLNSPGQANGEARMWVNDSLVFARTDLNIRDTMTAPINRVMFGGWYSNGCGGNLCADPDSSTVTSYLIDSMSVSRMRISGYDREFFQAPPVVEAVRETVYTMPSEIRFKFK